MIVQGEEVGHWVCGKAGGHWTHLCSAIGEVKDDKLVAGVMYDAFTGSSICIHSRIENKKASRKFYWAVFDYPFNQLNVKRLTGIVAASNKDAQRLNEHLGFKKEALLKDYFPDDDAIIYIMRKEDCRFLKLGERYGQ